MKDDSVAGESSPLETPETALYAETVHEQIRRWDAGDSIWTIEVGGLGPSYEQAIQIAAIEIARACKDLVGLKKKDEESTNRFRLAYQDRLKGMGLSGAQVGAAEWLAFQWCANGGPRMLIQRAKLEGKENQVIQATKYFPEAPKTLPASVVAPEGHLDGYSIEHILLSVTVVHTNKIIQYDDDCARLIEKHLAEYNGVVRVSAQVQYDHAKIEVHTKGCECGKCKPI